MWKDCGAERYGYVLMIDEIKEQKPYNRDGHQMCIVGLGDILSWIKWKPFFCKQA